MSFCQTKEKCQNVSGRSFAWTVLSRLIQLCRQIGCSVESEEGRIVTVEYEVCNIAPNPDVCATATVYIEVEDIPEFGGSSWFPGYQ